MPKIRGRKAVPLIMNISGSGRTNDGTGNGPQSTAVAKTLRTTRDSIRSEVIELERALQNMDLQTAAATKRNETRAELEAQLTTAKKQENQRATELPAAQTTLDAAELIVTNANASLVEIATSLSVWEADLKHVQEGEARNNKKMNEQSGLVLSLRQTGPPGWRWQAPSNNSTESGATVLIPETT